MSKEYYRGSSSSAGPTSRKVWQDTGPWMTRRETGPGRSRRNDGVFGGRAGMGPGKDRRRPALQLQGVPELRNTPAPGSDGDDERRGMAVEGEDDERRAE